MGVTKVLSKTIVKARWEPKTKDAETAKAEFSIMPFLSILLITPKVVAFVTNVPKNANADILLTPIFEPNLPKGLSKTFEIININGKVPERVTHALAQTKAAFSNVSKCGLISILVKNVNTEHTNPTIPKNLIKFPKTVKHLMQMSGIKIRQVPIIIERIMRGKRLTRSAMTGNLQIRPATKLPTGIVAIPQRIPKKSSLWFSLAVRPKAKGIVNETTQPIMEETMKAL